MIGKYLTNMNNLIQYIIMFLILLLIIYLIYKLFIVENDIYIINERLSRFELQTNEPMNVEKNYERKKEEELAETFMNEIFVSDEKEDEPSAIDIDEIIKSEEKSKKEEIFDLKKDVLTTEDNLSVVSSSNNKKKLQKLNLDKLKEKCQELGLSQEGTKANLIDRILDDNTNKDV